MRGAGPAGSPGRSQCTASLPRGGGYSRLGPHVLKKVRTGGAAAKTRAERHDTARGTRRPGSGPRAPRRRTPPRRVRRREAFSWSAGRARERRGARRSLWAIRRTWLALRVAVCGGSALGVRGAARWTASGRGENGAGTHHLASVWLKAQRSTPMPSPRIRASHLRRRRASRTSRRWRGWEYYHGPSSRRQTTND